MTTTPTAEWRAFNWIDPKVITFTRDGVDVYARLFTPEMIGAKRDPVATGRGVRARRGIPAERAQVLVHLLPRIHVPQPARLARVCRARRRLPRQLWIRPRLAHGDLSPHGRQGPRGHRGRRQYLSAKEGVHPKRIGVYGGSYGGFITLMGMFTTPDVFAAGAALRP